MFCYSFISKVMDISNILKPLNVHGFNYPPTAAQIALFPLIYRRAFVQMYYNFEGAKHSRAEQISILLEFSKKYVLLPCFWIYANFTTEDPSGCQLPLRKCLTFSSEKYGTSPILAWKHAKFEFPGFYYDSDIFYAPRRSVEMAVKIMTFPNRAAEIAYGNFNNYGSKFSFLV